MQTKVKEILDGMTPEQQRQFEGETFLDLKELIYNIQKYHPFYTAILSKFIKEISYEVPVAAVTFRKGSPLLMINPIGFGAYSNREKVFILIHEIMHIVNQHHLRGKGKDPGVFNIAADVSINQLIESQIAYRPADCLMPHHFDLPNALSTEQYYDILISRDEPITLPDELKNSLLQDLMEGDEEDGEGQGGGQGNGDGPEQDGQGGQDGQPGKGGKGKGGQGKGKPTKAPGFDKLHPSWKEVQEMSEDLVKGLTKGLVEQAINRSAGKVPGELKQAIEDLFEPQVKWDRVLRSFASSVLSTKRRQTWSRPNRKFGEIKMGTLRKKELNLLVAIDTSASLSTAELTMFLSEVKSLKEKTNAKITIVQCDTHIHEVVDFDRIDIKKFEVKGRGGTSLIPPFELVTKRKKHGHTLSESIDGVIYLTDGEGEAPLKQAVRTLWVLSPGGRTPYASNGNDITWGQKIFLNDGKPIKERNSY